MKQRPTEKGQALIVIALAAIVLFGFTALAVDGSRSMEDRRRAQNAADASALAGALAFSRGNDINAAVNTRAASNGYDGISNNTVTVTITDVPAGICPANIPGKDIKVDIFTQINTSIGKVIGQNVLKNNVSATARSCGNYFGPPFNGNALVSLAPTGKAFDGTGNPSWNITGGGIFSNSSSSNAAYCNGSANISAPSITTVGGIQLNCQGVTIPTNTTGAPQYSVSTIQSIMPREPACNGQASLSNGQWIPQPGADGSRVTFIDDMVFAPGVYCVTNSGTFTINGTISGIQVFFYVMNNTNFTMKFAGAGSGLDARSPTTGEYTGILMYLKPAFDSSGNLIQTQALQLRGNGNAGIVGTIWAPSAEVSMFGNSNSKAFNSQIIAYNINSGGTADINLAYKPNRNHNASLPITLYLIK
jgi:hypothetical protein